MVVSIAKIGVEHAEYFVLTAKAEQKARAAAGATRYYLPDAPGLDTMGQGRWAATGDLCVSADASIDRAALTRFLAGRDPGTGKMLARQFTPGGTFTDRRGIERRRRSVSAYDCTYSIPKSISAAWAVADPETRAHIEAAFLESVSAVVQHLQDHAVHSRRKAGGKEHVAVPNGVPVLKFVHTSSRAGDPQLHAHLLVQNLVKCEDGQWRTLDGRQLYANLAAASLRGAAVLRTALTMRLGWAWGVIDERLHADLAGIPADLLAEWSRRSRAVAKAAADLVSGFESQHRREPTPAERHMLWDQASVDTRQAKGEPVTEDQHERWADEARSLGLEPQDVIAAIGAAQPAQRDTYDRAALSIADAADPAAALTVGVAEAIQAQAEITKVELTDADIAAAAAAVISPTPELSDHPAISDRTATEIVNDAIARVQQTLRQRMIDTPSDQIAAPTDAKRWHSPGLVAAELAAIGWLRSPFAEPAGVPTSDLDTDGLSPDQAAAAEMVVNARTNGVAIVGPAGAGKTTTLRRIVGAIGADNVIAVAPTATAARTLGQAIGTRASTVARALTGIEPFPAAGLCVVDEASQLSTRDLAALLGLCAGQGLRVVQVGDNSQQGSVSAGGIFETVTDSAAIPTAALTTLHRFADPHERAATAALRTGSPKALDYHRNLDRIASGVEANAAEAAADWWQQRRHLDTVISAPGMETVHAINAEIAARRLDLGELGDVVAEVGGGHLARTGDIVVTRRNASRLTTRSGRAVNNGDRWILTGPAPNGGLRVADIDNPADTVELPARYAARWAQLGYSITHTRAQSVTVDEALTIVGNSTSLPAMYVGLTRGAKGNWLHVLTDRPSFDADVPTEHDDPDAVLAAVVARRQHRFTASRTPAPDEHPIASPALHLHAIAQTPHTQPLPVPERFDAAPWIRPRTNHDGTRADELTWHFEDQLQAAWSEADALVDAGYYDYLDHTGADSADDHFDAVEHLGDVTADLDPHSHLYAVTDESPPDSAYEGAQYDPDRIIEEGDIDMATATAHVHTEPRQGVDIAALHDELARIGFAEWIARRWGVAVGKHASESTRVECPIHEPGHTRSAHVIPGGNRQLFSCFRCGELGIDAITLIERVEHCSTRDAIARLAADLDVTATAQYVPQQRPQRPSIDLRPTSDVATALPHLDARQRTRFAELLAHCDAPTADVKLHPAVAHAAAAAEAAHAADDPEAKRSAAARLASLADPSTAARLARSGITPDEDPDAPTIRAEIIADRLLVYADEIAELAELRTQGIPHQDRPAAAAGFAAAVHKWLTDPTAHPLSHHYADPAPPDPAFADCDQLAGAYIGYLGQPTTPTPLPAARPTAIAAAATRPTPPPQAEREGTTPQGWAALDSAARWYSDQLAADTPQAHAAREYLNARGITPEDCHKWGIGWAPDAWHALCDHIGDEDLAHHVGLAGESPSGRRWDFLRSRIVFPIRDPQGRIAGFAGRHMAPDDDTPKYLNLRNTAYNTKGDALYGADQAAPAIARSATAIVVEGYTDVIAAHRAGITNAVAGCGTAIADGHLRTLARLGADTLTACLDSDQAGRQAALKLVRNAAEHRLPTRIAELPAGHDPADLTPDELHDSLTTPLPAIAAAVHAAVEDHDPTDASSTADRLAAALACHDLRNPAIAAAARASLISALGSQWHRVAPPPAAPQRDTADERSPVDRGETISR